VDLLVGEAGGGIDRDQPGQHIGGQADLFLELALGAGGRGLARIEPPGRDLPDGAIGRMAELANEVNPGIGPPRFIQKWNDRGRARMPDHLQLAGGPIGETHRIPVQVDHPAVVQSFRGDERHGTWG